MSASDALRRYRATLAKGARPGERVFARYSQDCAMCACPSVERHAGVDTTVVARGFTLRGAYDRCLQCGKAWTARELRSDPARAAVGPRATRQRPARAAAPARRDQAQRAERPILRDRARVAARPVDRVRPQAVPVPLAGPRDARARPHRGRPLLRGPRRRSTLAAP